jgi:hypothetical protein
MMLDKLKICELVVANYSFWLQFTGFDSVELC